MKGKLYLQYFIVLLMLLNLVVPASASTYYKPRMDGGIKVEEERVKEEKNYLKVDLSIPRLTIPGNRELETEINKRLYEDAQAFKEGVEKDALATYQQLINKGVPVTPYEAVSKYVLHNSKDLLSLTVNYYQYTGGAHGDYIIKPYNYQIKTGKPLALKDFFKEGYDYKTIINNEIKKIIAKDPQNYFTDGFKSIRDDQEFFITPQGIVVYFQVYDIAPFAAGVPEFPIPFSKLKEGLVDSLVR